MDIVICVAYKNCFFLRKNIYFIEKNLSPSHIYIVTNKTNFKLLDKLSQKVHLIDENSMVDGLSFSAVRKALKEHLGIKLVGWYFQQFLKMGFALSEYACDNYLVWDADTVPLNHLEFKDMGGVLIYAQNRVPSSIFRHYRQAL